MSAHGDHVVIHNTWRGTHLGDFLGAPPTGQAIEFTGVVVWRLLADGLIAERWGIGVESTCWPCSACAGSPRRPQRRPRRGPPHRHERRRPAAAAARRRRRLARP